MRLQPPFSHRSLPTPHSRDGSIHAHDPAEQVLASNGGSKRSRNGMAVSRPGTAVGIVLLDALFGSFGYIDQCVAPPLMPKTSTLFSLRNGQLIRHIERSCRTRRDIHLPLRADKARRLRSAWLTVLGWKTWKHLKRTRDQSGQSGKSGSAIACRKHKFPRSHVLLPHSSLSHGSWLEDGNGANPAFFRKTEGHIYRS